MNAPCKNCKDVFEELPSNIEIIYRDSFQEGTEVILKEIYEIIFYRQFGDRKIRRL